ncbi:hypothetical protein CVT25_014999 [Psilocybe cyanescens]|uniref:Uncharacterized protein n=1 Tax=Psilocybe cyanescens TaxID=93625 RepID=A0A409XIC7_PSICY|nr:hypothetical protein CVT25_014999 [Psilocybe cyanescens]
MRWLAGETTSASSSLSQAQASKDATLLAFKTLKANRNGIRVNLANRAKQEANWTTVEEKLSPIQSKNAQESLEGKVFHSGLGDLGSKWLLTMVVVGKMEAHGVQVVAAISRGH